MAGKGFDIDEQERHPMDKMYFVVFGLFFGILLGAIGGTMAYLAYTKEIKEDYTSLAEAYNIPTAIISIVLSGLGALFMLIAILALICARCDCSKPKPIKKSPSGDVANSPQVFIISNESLRL